MSDRHELCQKCQHKGHCQLGTHAYMKPLLDCGCDQFRLEKPRMTNGDKFRAMSNEELADYLHLRHMCDYCPAKATDCDTSDINNSKTCKAAWLSWLKQEAK